jgi:hypothetical protein
MNFTKCIIAYLEGLDFWGLVFGGLELQNTITRAFELMIKCREIELTLVHGEEVGSQSAGLQAA